MLPAATVQLCSNMRTNKSQNIVKSLNLVIWALRLSGLFPYILNSRKNCFHISWPLLLITLLHILFFGYVNLILLLTDWHNYAQPVAAPSTLAVLGNLLQRLLGVATTLVILVAALLGNRNLVAYINRYLSFLDDLVALGLSTQLLSRRLRNLTCASLVALVAAVAGCSVHFKFFYRLITGKDPTLFFYLCIGLCNFYRLMFSLFMWLQLLIVYYMSQQLNRLMADLAEQERERFLQRRQPAVAWSTKPPRQKRLLD